MPTEPDKTPDSPLQANESSLNSLLEPMRALHAALTKEESNTPLAQQAILSLENTIDKMQTLEMTSEMINIITTVNEAVNKKVDHLPAEQQTMLGLEDSVDKVQSWNMINKTIDIIAELNKALNVELQVFFSFTSKLSKKAITVELQVFSPFANKPREKTATIQSNHELNYTKEATSCFQSIKFSCATLGETLAKLHHLLNFKYTTTQNSEGFPAFVYHNLLVEYARVKAMFQDLKKKINTTALVKDMLKSEDILAIEQSLDKAFAQAIKDCKKDLAVYLARLKFYAQDLDENLDDNFSECVQPDQIKGFDLAAKKFEAACRRIGVVYNLYKKPEDVYKFLITMSFLKPTSIIHQLPTDKKAVVMGWILRSVAQIIGKKSTETDNGFILFTSIVNKEQKIINAIKSAEEMLTLYEADKTEISSVTPDKFIELVNLTENNPSVSFEEVQARDKKRRKEIEKEKREASHTEGQVQQKLSFFAQNKQQEQAAQKEKISHEQERLLTHFKNMNTRKQALLIALLDPSQDKHKTYDEAEVMNVLSLLQLDIKETKKGGLVQLEASSASFHTPHDREKKLDGHFIKAIRETLFKVAKITMSVLIDNIPACEASSSSSSC